MDIEELKKLWEIDGPWLFFGGVLLLVFIFWIISIVARRGKSVGEDRDNWGLTILLGPLGLLYGMQKHKKLRRESLQKRLARKKLLRLKQQRKKK